MSNLNIAKLISFISSHFYETSKEKIKLLPIEIIKEILDNESLKLIDEDSLLNLIIEFYLQDDKYSILFECVNFSNVGEESFAKFIQIFNIEHLDASIWSSICERLLPSKRKNSKERYAIRYKEFKHDRNNEFHGIMRYLTEVTHGNIHDNGTIEITSNSVYDSSKNPKNLVDYEDTYSEYYSKGDDGKEHVIVFDFKDKLIQLESYTIQSRFSGPNNVNLKNWVFEVSNDGSFDDWIVVDRRDNDATLNGSNIIHNFELNQKKAGFYRYVRLRQTGDSWYSYDHKTIGFPLIEFYGKLKEESNK